MRQRYVLALPQKGTYFTIKVYTYLEPKHFEKLVSDTLTNLADIKRVIASGDQIAVHDFEPVARNFESWCMAKMQVFEDATSLAQHCLGVGSQLLLVFRNDCWGTVKLNNYHFDIQETRLAS